MEEETYFYAQPEPVSTLAASYNCRNIRSVSQLRWRAVRVAGSCDRDARGVAAARRTDVVFVETDLQDGPAIAR
jgi:hypothetical protein